MSEISRTRQKLRYSTHEARCVAPYSPPAKLETGRSTATVGAERCAIFSIAAQMMLTSNDKAQITHSIFEKWRAICFDVWFWAGPPASGRKKHKKKVGNNKNKRQLKIIDRYYVSEDCPGNFVTSDGEPGLRTFDPKSFYAASLNGSEQLISVSSTIPHLGDLN